MGNFKAFIKSWKNIRLTFATNYIPIWRRHVRFIISDQVSANTFYQVRKSIGIWFWSHLDILSKAWRERRHTIRSLIIYAYSYDWIKIAPNLHGLGFDGRHLWSFWKSSFTCMCLHENIWDQLPRPLYNLKHFQDFKSFCVKKILKTGQISFKGKRLCRRQWKR